MSANRFASQNVIFSQRMRVCVRIGKDVCVFCGWGEWQFLQVLEQETFIFLKAL